jgi:hypothetical protein
MHTITLTDDTFRRLENRVIGFETPEMVIKRLLDEIEGKSKKPKIIFDSNDEDKFKRELLKTKSAEIVLYNSSNEREIIHWNAERFSENSNLRANLWSGHLRDWKKRNIVKVELAILPKDNSYTEDGMEVIKNKAIALEIGLKYEEMEIIADEYKIMQNDSSDGMLYSYRIQFSDNCPKEILGRVIGLNDGKWAELSPNIFDELDQE